MTADVVQKLWGFCHTLRHEGVNYGHYLEQVTLLLFLRMADERGIDLPSYKTLDKHTDQRNERPAGGATKRAGGQTITSRSGVQGAE